MREGVVQKNFLGDRHKFAELLAECLLAEHWVEEAGNHLREEYLLAMRRLGRDHATTIGLELQCAEAVYKAHFFGREDYRQSLRDAMTLYVGLHVRLKRVLGIDHPLTRKVAAGFLRCFDEQLDWSLDDIPYERLAYRARLLGE